MNAFFTCASSLSNHHDSPMEVEGQSLKSNEQQYMFKKATTFADKKTADAIMRESDHGKIKGLGNNDRIKNFNITTWDNRCLDIMKTGLMAKFQQNPTLKMFLLETGDTYLVEASPRDTFWGCGISLRNKRLWEKNSWMGKADNHLGQILMDIRREFKQLEQ